MGEPPDPARCPLCGADNRCARAAGRAGETCWCVNARFSPALLERIPEAARGKACVCAECAARGEGSGEAESGQASEDA